MGPLMKRLRVQKVCHVMLLEFPAGSDTNGKPRPGGLEAQRDQMSGGRRAYFKQFSDSPIVN
jgi:hypothetical protein